MPVERSVDAPPAVRRGRRSLLLWALREDVLVETGCPGGSVVLSGRWGEVRLHHARPAVHEALRRMSLGPISLANVVADSVVCSSSAEGSSVSTPVTGSLAEILVALQRLQHLVVRSLCLDSPDHLLLSVVPISPSARFGPGGGGRRQPIRLSQYAFLRTEGKGFVLESPISLHRVVLHSPEAAWVVGMLGRPVTSAEVAAAVPLPAEATMEIIAHLLATGMAVPAEPSLPPPGSGPEPERLDARDGSGAPARATGPDRTGALDRTAGSDRPGAPGVPGAPDTPAAPGFAEDRDSALASWSAVDLLFHTRSTLGRHDADFGATYPLAERMAPAPAVKPLPDGPRIVLKRPSPSGVKLTDPPLTTVVEERRSVRSFGSARLDADTLGEFLHRALRVRSLHENRHNAQEGPFTDRPYPSGGRAFELEFYLSVRDCAGIPPGIHYYAPLEHCLVQVGDAEPGSGMSELFDEARITAGLTDLPAVVITITSRIHRLTWKYSGLAYALTLKHVGAVTQNLYLIGTAMGLAPCALGSGDIELAARATGQDWRIEPSVGGFVLGTLPQERELPASAAHDFHRSNPQTGYGVHRPSID
ncbi:SagB/ThcOx family dehydrogenase [Streptomyces katsurahamanus]|uniref:SagB/ThcOx family dehydrogenase n=1 Tax=Streptomyces katsurahamanus TaxID=2577098 RepID=A0ABW9NX85_9ACTN|nr:SagB family peptide dehydrogenase [Streptomyces katsurahamanus]MQS37887.1 SagB/ThcOx family dehydrogenase [Streptomyces katsurahamanus]